MTNDQKTLRLRAIFFDMIGLIICGAMLWLGSNTAAPMWVLIAGAVIAVAFVIAAIVCSAKARKLDVERFKAANGNNNDSH